MSSLEVRTALETALSAITPTFSTAWENVDFTPVAGTPYQKAHLLLADPDNKAFGASYQEQGIFQVNLFYPLGTGSAVIETRAKLIRSTFYRGMSFTSGGVTVRISKTPSIGAGSRDGDRWMVPVKIIFFCNVTGA